VTFKGAIKLIRPLNLVIVIFATLVSFAVVRSFEDPVQFLKFVVPLLLLAAFSNCLNDCADAELDKQAHPSRPIAKGEVSVSASKWLSVVLGFLTLVSAMLYTKAVTRWVLIAGFLLAIFYDILLKKVAFVGNLVVSILTSFPFLLMWLETGNWSLMWFPVLCATVYNLGREAVKDMEDFNVDSKFGYKTLPFFLGERGIRIYVSLLLIVLILFTVIAFLKVFRNPVFLVLLSCSFLYLIIRVATEKSFSRLSGVFKNFMIFTLLGITLGGVL